MMENKYTITEEFWDFIEKYLPDYNEREDVLRIGQLQLYIDGHESPVVDEMARDEAEDELHRLLYNAYIQAIQDYTKGLGIECEDCESHSTNYCPVCGKKRNMDMDERELEY